MSDTAMITESSLTDAAIDANLVARMANGDHAALGVLYDRHAAYLLAVGVRFLGRSDAEDVLHDVFVEAHRSAKDFDPARGRVRTWLAIRMRCRAIDHVTAPRVTRNAGEEPLHTALDETPAQLDGPVLALALATLAKPQRTVIVMAYYGGMTCVEIAKQLAIPTGTVKSRLASGLDGLRTTMRRQPRAA
jgi:RNA polymerase sigma-70 factor (ECF subfamily)